MIEIQNIPILLLAMNSCSHVCEHLLRPRPTPPHPIVPLSPMTFFVPGHTLIPLGSGAWLLWPKKLSQKAASFIICWIKICIWNTSLPFFSHPTGSPIWNMELFGQKSSFHLFLRPPPPPWTTFQNVHRLSLSLFIHVWIPLGRGGVSGQCTNKTSLTTCKSTCISDMLVSFRKEQMSMLGLFWFYISHNPHLYMESWRWRRFCFDVREDHVIFLLQASIHCIFEYQNIPEELTFHPLQNIACWQMSA